ncbi:hypothetical protein PR048_011585 [Dryococelus australis]|uniref:Uncharacterized protein n=1 Tax=Dryococelus australis TaxID=614101 RepID=A0ABQ9HM16_9NEOP|nr:hypothetical protein PR048_011585 [Dryococelus australis]
MFVAGPDASETSASGRPLNKDHKRGVPAVLTFACGYRFLPARTACFGRTPPRHVSSDCPGRRDVTGGGGIGVGARCVLPDQLNCESGPRKVTPFSPFLLLFISPSFSGIRQSIQLRVSCVVVTIRCGAVSTNSRRHTDSSVWQLLVRFEKEHTDGTHDMLKRVSRTRYQQIAAGSPPLDPGVHVLAQTASGIEFPVLAAVLPFSTDTLALESFTPPRQQTCFGGVVSPALTLQAPHLALKSPHLALQTPHLAPKAPHLALQAPHLVLQSPHLALQVLHMALQALQLALKSPHLALQTPHLAPKAPHLALQAPHLVLQSPHLALQVPHMALQALQSETKCTAVRDRRIRRRAVTDCSTTYTEILQLVRPALHLLLSTRTILPRLNEGGLQAYHIVYSRAIFCNFGAEYPMVTRSKITLVLITNIIPRVALEDVYTFPWPTRSHDLSSAEHVWDMMVRRLHIANHLPDHWLRRNDMAKETGENRENSPTSGIVRHDSQLKKSGVNRPGIGPGSPLWEASVCPHKNTLAVGPLSPFSGTSTLGFHAAKYLGFILACCSTLLSLSHQISLLLFFLLLLSLLGSHLIQPSHTRAQRERLATLEPRNLICHLSPILEELLNYIAAEEVGNTAAAGKVACVQEETPFSLLPENIPFANVSSPPPPSPALASSRDPARQLSSLSRRIFFVREQRIPDSEPELAGRHVVTSPIRHLKFIVLGFFCLLRTTCRRKLVGEMREKVKETIIFYTANTFTIVININGVFMIVFTSCFITNPKYPFLCRSPVFSISM